MSDPNENGIPYESEQSVGNMYANVSATFSVGVPADRTTRKKRHIAKQVANDRFEETFSFRPGLRSEVLAEPTGHKLTDNVALEKWRVSIVAQAKRVGPQ